MTAPRTGERAARQAAADAMANAYAPYSGFAVGAALLTDDGRVFSGCNVENASYPAGLCAERAALAVAVAQGARAFSLLVVSTLADHPTPPCGVCRQAIAEFAPAVEVVSVARGGEESRWSMVTLLPEPFTPACLKHA